VLATATCTRADALAPGASYPPITLTANVSGSALAVLINTVSVSGGGDLSSGNDVAADSATVFAVGGGVAVPVPALSNWALYLLAMLMLGLGFALRRRAWR